MSRATWDELSLDDDGYGTRPPVWSHIAIYVGNLAKAFPFRYPTRGPRLTDVDGLFARSRSDAIFLGSYTWGGKHGSVVLAPGYPSGGEHGNHLIFRWRQSGLACAVGLHGWEPLRQALATLRLIVRSI
jgi:hypothetical protein